MRTSVVVGNGVDVLGVAVQLGGEDDGDDDTVDGDDLVREVSAGHE